MTTEAAGSPALSFRVSKVLNRAAVMGSRMHDMRLGKQPSYVDGSRSDQNTTLALVDGYDKQGSAWSRFFSREEQELAARRKQQSKTQKMWRSAILTFSKAAQELLTTPLTLKPSRSFGTSPDATTCGCSGQLAIATKAPRITMRCSRM